uniref:Zinc finger PHD-type domain-containing protein n=1 Tax=Zea mays TaxID=4577 RepID=A0A804P5Y0_MAIZE
MPPPSASASPSASRFAKHWIADVLAGEESVDFSLLKVLVGASSKPLAGAPEATRERVALRSIQEVLSVIAAGGDAAATAGVLSVDGARSCEDGLFRLIREVGSFGELEKDLLPPFSQDIQENICTKKFTLPGISFQLLERVEPWIASMAPQPQMEHNGTEQCVNDQSLRSSHGCVNIEKPVFHTDNAGVQQETMADVVNESETGNLQKDPPAPTFIFHQPCMPESRSYVPPQEDTIDAVGLGARSSERSPIVEGNMSVGSVLASDGCDVPLQGSITEPFFQQDKHDHTVIVGPKSCKRKSPIPSYCAHGDGADGGGSSNQSSKVSIREGPSTHATVTSGFDRISDVLPTDAPESEHLPECITAQDTTISQPDSRKAHLSALQQERGEKVTQDLEDISANIGSVEKDHIHGDLTLPSASVLLSISCNGANQGSKYETNLQPGTATEDMMAFEEQNADKSHLEVSGINKANQALHDDGGVMKNNTVHGGLIVQTAPVSQNCNVTLHDKTSEQENEKNIQKDNCHTYVPGSSQDRGGESAKKTTNELKSGDISSKICVHFNVQDINDTLEDLSQQGLCIKCGEGGQLLECNGCFLAAHSSCFGSSATFEGTNFFYCPVCLYKKATEAYKKAKKTYCETRKNLVAFLGTAQATNQPDKQLNGAQPGAANRDEEPHDEQHSKGCGASKGAHENEVYNLAHQDEEHHQQRKKQKINAIGKSYPKEVLTEKVIFQNSDPASINKHSVLQNNNKTPVKDPEKKQQAVNEEARKEGGNDNSSHETGASSPRRCDPPSNQDVEADQDDSLTTSNQSGGSDEIEATSSNDSAKQSSPPWRGMGHNKKGLHEKEPAVSSKSGKGIGKQDQHMHTSRRKKKMHTCKSASKSGCSYSTTSFL